MAARQADLPGHRRQSGRRHAVLRLGGARGAGHFVKMVHNGIEYGDMQLICEAYHVMRTMLGLKPAAMHDVFARWNRGPLDSYLIEITRDILGFVDPETGKPMIDLILDTAGQKGTGKWTVITACDLGVPLTLISEAVFARTLSAQKDERVAASKVLTSRSLPFSGNLQTMVDDLERHSTPARSSPMPRASAS